MTTLDYNKMSLEQIHDDLLETVNDIYYNAAQNDLESVISDFEKIDESTAATPSENLIRIMTEIYAFDSDLTKSIPKRLIREAVDEMIRLSPIQDIAG